MLVQFSVVYLAFSGSLCVSDRCPSNFCSHKKTPCHVSCVCMCMCRQLIRSFFVRRINWQFMLCCFRWFLFRFMGVSLERGEQQTHSARALTHTGGRARARSRATAMCERFLPPTTRQAVKMKQFRKLLAFTGAES